MWRWVALVAVLGWVDQVPAARVMVADGRAERSVLQAVRGAGSRLMRPSCQLLLTDFRDAEGRTLADRLQEIGATPSEYLARYILFVAADDTPQCRRDEVVTAFTSPGYKVVHVCGARFAARFERESAVTELLIIHEMLHTLGLGENPPSSSAITGQVTKRCGGS